METSSYLFSKNKYIKDKKNTNLIESSVWIPQVEKPFSVLKGESSTSNRKSFSENRTDNKDIKEIKEMMRSLSLRLG